MDPLPFLYRESYVANSPYFFLIVLGNTSSSLIFWLFMLTLHTWRGKLLNSVTVLTIDLLKTCKMNTTVADIELQGLRFREIFRSFCYLSQHVPEERLKVLH